MSTPINYNLTSLALTEIVTLSGPIGGGSAPVGSVLTFAFPATQFSSYTLANGQLLAIADYPFLYAEYGTAYGGDGVTTFGIPNLNAATMIGAGQGPGLTNHPLGQTAGSADLSLSL